MSERAQSNSPETLMVSCFVQFPLLALRCNDTVRYSKGQIRSSVEQGIGEGARELLLRAAPDEPQFSPR
jgi:hypothetical protein